MVLSSKLKFMEKSLLRCDFLMFCHLSMKTKETLLAT